MTTYNTEKLNELYDEANQADSEIFAEQRSNVLLIAGEHYTRKNAKYWNRVRDSKDLSNEQKLRLTKNHIQKITKQYINNIVSQAPSVVVVPANEKEIQDQKAAQLNNSVWQYARDKHNISKKTQEWAKDFIDIGEVACKIFWNPSAGKFLGWRAELDEAGNPVMDESGQMVASKEPAFTGDLVFERIFAFNLLRDASAKNMEDSKFLIIRKMVDTEGLKKMVGDDEEKLKLIKETIDDTYMVFDGNMQNYQQTKGQTLLKEIYFKPSAEFPMGYFYLWVDGGVLFEGELPFGVFPILYEGFDEIQTSPRHRSIVKVLRPYQAELNRAASKIAEHQVTLGDDKLLVQSGTKVTTGIHLPGVRSIQFSGMQPGILQGRSGEQYVAYMQSQIEEMYSVANMNEEMIMKEMKADPFGQLFMSLRDKKKFSMYAEKFEYFLQAVCKTYLDLARHYFSEDMIIPMVGRSEHVNIAEFKTTSEICYHINIEPMTDDIETMMGKQLTINHALQYVSNKLSQEDIGKLIRAMPFGNLDESFNDLTLEYDTATNMILALDRGEQPPISRYDNHQYLIKRLVSRVRQSDFSMLSPEIQQMYMAYIQQYEQLEVEQQQQILAAQSEFIPSGGARVKVDYYVPKGNDPSKVERATLPAESVDWLIKKLAQQGSSQEILMQMNQGAVAEMASQLNMQQGISAQQGSLQGPSVTTAPNSGGGLLQ